MSDTVIVTEKPKQAKNVLAAIGERLGVVLTAQGHLARLRAPDEVREEWKSWSFDLLIPPGGRFGWVADEDRRKRSLLAAIREGLRSARRLVIATDSDREGQLIGEEIVELLKFRGEILRATFTAEDPKSLQAAFAALKPNRDFAGLREAAITRQELDQRWNLTLTRAATVALRGALDNDKPVGVGRVKSPTLAIVCRRELEIRNFVERVYFVIPVRAETEVGALELAFDPKEDRIYDRSVAEAIAQAANGYKGPLLVDRKQKDQAPPKFLDLPQLQRIAGGWGWSAQKTLDVAQALYDGVNLITYPRVEVKVLPGGHAEFVPTILAGLRRIENFSVSCPGAPTIRRGKGGHFDDAGLKGEPHHAIVPNVNVMDRAPELYAGLDQDQRRLFDLVARRFLAAISPDHKYEATRVQIEVPVQAALAGAPALVFLATGRVTVEDGWRRALEPAQGGEDEEDARPLPPVVNGMQAVLQRMPDCPQERRTKPPSRYNEGGLIEAMLNAWRFVEDPQLAERLKDAKGIGTSATRAEVIEGLKRQGQLAILRKNIVPTEGGLRLYQLFQKVAPEVVDPGLTARVELMLDEILAGQATADEVLGRAMALLEPIVAKIRAVAGQFSGSREPSPRMKAAAQAIVRAKNLQPPDGWDREFDICKRFLDAHPFDSATVAAPSPAQIALVRKLAAEAGEELPATAEVLTDRKKATAYISARLDSKGDAEKKTQGSSKPRATGRSAVGKRKARR